MQTVHLSKSVMALSSWHSPPELGAGPLQAVRGVARAQAWGLVLPAC